MSVAQIILLILGIFLFIASFVIPERKNKINEEDIKLSETTVKEMINGEMEQTRSHIQDIVDETVSYTVEKTERSLDRLTNEKMQAVKEYSDTVLEEINQNHKEVMFLYDMLNDKQEALKDTVQIVQKTTKEVKSAVEAAAAMPPEQTVQIPAEVPADKPVKEKAVSKKAAAKKPALQKVIPELVGGESNRNSNDKILKLYKEGKTKMTIAKELGLGLGEVKLVIDLYEGM